VAPVPRVLLATDADWIHEEVDAALAGDDIEVLRVREGVDVLPAVHQLDPDLVVLDLQIGNMGGVATALGLRNEESAGRLEPSTILMLLDRTADVFISQQAHADGWLVKPLDSLRLRRAAEALLAGGTYTDGLAS
jgi:DNA-binding response OmpR family regulator